jgi:hypothetical protein
LRIVGVKDVEAIRDYLYARMRGIETEQPTDSSPDALLVEIRDELRGAAAALIARQE